MTDAATYVIAYGWICRDIGRCNCGGGGEAANGVHEAGCGLEPVATVEDALAALTEVGRLRGERDRAQHGVELLAALARHEQEEGHRC